TLTIALARSAGKGASHPVGLYSDGATVMVALLDHSPIGNTRAQTNRRPAMRIWISTLSLMPALLIALPACEPLASTDQVGSTSYALSGAGTTSPSGVGGGGNATGTD